MITAAKLAAARMEQPSEGAVVALGRPGGELQ